MKTHQRGDARGDVRGDAVTALSGAMNATCAEVVTVLVRPAATLGAVKGLLPTGAHRAGPDTVQVLARPTIRVCRMREAEAQVGAP